MRTLVIAALIGLSAGAARGQPFDDTLVQAPTLGQPQRGSIAGTLSKTSLGPSDLLTRLVRPRTIGRSTRGTWAAPRRDLSLVLDRGGAE